MRKDSFLFGTLALSLIGLATPASVFANDNPSQYKPIQNIVQTTNDLGTLLYLVNKIDSPQEQINVLNDGSLSMVHAINTPSHPAPEVITRPNFTAAPASPTPCAPAHVIDVPQNTSLSLNFINQHP